MGVMDSFPFSILTDVTNDLVQGERSADLPSPLNPVFRKKITKSRALSTSLRSDLRRRGGRAEVHAGVQRECTTDNATVTTADASHRPTIHAPTPPSRTQTATGVSPAVIWIIGFCFVCVVGLAYKFVSASGAKSVLELPLADAAGHPENVRVFLEIGNKDRFKDVLNLEPQTLNPKP